MRDDEQPSPMREWTLMNGTFLNFRSFMTDQDIIRFAEDLGVEPEPWLAQRHGEGITR